MPEQPQTQCSWRFAMQARETVILAYRAMLGREPDHAGLEYWTRAVTEAGDPTVVFAGIAASSEYRERTAGTEDWMPVASHAVALLARPPVIVDIGAQALDGHVYDRLTAHFPCELIGFDPLEERLDERRSTEGRPGLHLLPYAIGDGATHVLHINNEDATSSLFPLNSSFTCQFNHLSSLTTVATTEVSTKRLDDVVRSPRIDLMKLDIQGAELMALTGATDNLSRTAVVHCEVEFAEIYQDQPLFGEVDRLLRSAGFEFIDLPVLKRYHYVGDKAYATSLDRLIWGDAVYFKTTDDPAVLAAQALIAAAVYGKLSLAQHLLGRLPHTPPLV